MSKSRAVLFVIVGYALAVALAHLLPPLPASLQATFVGRVLSLLLIRVDQSDEEDRPPIIVRSGSIFLDDGDALYPYPAWQDWDSLGATGGHTSYAPKQPKGAPPKMFEIMALNVVVTSSCPAVPFVADHVDLTYTGVGGGASTTATIYVGKSNGKPAPVFETSLTMKNEPGGGTGPGVLSYTTDGTLSGFTTKTPKGDSISCVFDANRGPGYLRVLPMK